MDMVRSNITAYSTDSVLIIGMGLHFAHPFFAASAVAVMSFIVQYLIMR